MGVEEECGASRNISRHIQKSLEASRQNVPHAKTLIDASENSTSEVEKPNNPSKYEWEIVWRNVIAFVYLHAVWAYAIYAAYHEMKVLTIVWNTFVGMFSLMGITVGAHRLWCHQSFKAKWPLRTILMIFQTMAFEDNIYEWVRDHRVHHKFTDTDADPYSSRRGFFFSHMGWLMVRKHPDVAKKGKTIDMSDLEKDPIVVWQRKFYSILMPTLCFILPTWLPCYLWNERAMLAWCSTVFRYTTCLHLTWVVNSVAHKFGNKPFDSSISPMDNKDIPFGWFGEGWHNYHHVFPWDYKVGEYPDLRFNLGAAFIKMFAAIGWAYDLKTAPISMVVKRAARTGDGSRVPKNDRHHEHSHEVGVWGWGDSDMSSEDIKDAHISNEVY